MWSTGEKETAPWEQLPPLEQRAVPRRSRQRLLRELISPASVATKGMPPEPAGNKPSGCVGDRANDQLNSVEEHTRSLMGEQQGYSGEEGIQMIVQKDVRMDIQLHGSAGTQTEHSTVSPSDVNSEKHRRQGVCKNVVFLPPEQTVVENKDNNLLDKLLENQNDCGGAGNQLSTSNSKDKIADAQLRGGGLFNKSVNVEEVMCEFMRGG